MIEKLWSANSTFLSLKYLSFAPWTHWRFQLFYFLCSSYAMLVCLGDTLLRKYCIITYMLAKFMFKDENSKQLWSLIMCQLHCLMEHLIMNWAL